MPRNDQVTRQWHLLQHLGAARNGLTLAEPVEAIPAELLEFPYESREFWTGLALSCLGGCPLSLAPPIRIPSLPAALSVL